MDGMLELSFLKLKAPQVKWRPWDAKIRNVTSDFKRERISGALAASFFSAFGTVVQKMKQIKHQSSGGMEPKREER
jgi:hypothetical protein